MAVQTLSTPVTPMCTEISLSLFLEKTIETKNITKQQQQKTNFQKKPKQKNNRKPRAENWESCYPELYKTHGTLHTSNPHSGSKHGSELPVITSETVTYCFT